ncbi:phenylacetyl-CoA ligase [Artomyces pyxidatus]|uniref:Phenylacetyl-CoA ligase n=1 Tax=Artomyces pyxidatus TaxID=48021 RepID=A0ACB8TF66_9AGAM|nr:phenylacetyl-CoA ligase [Artomyces pyxidatus]
MSEILPARSMPLEIIPDDVTLAQFMLDRSHPYRPTRPAGVPWLIEESTGRAVALEEIRERVFGLANALSFKYGIGENDVVSLFSPNHMDYVVAVWAVHRLGGALTLSNPAFMADELQHQLIETKVKLVIAHSLSLEVAHTAAALSGISSDRVVILDDAEKPGTLTVPSLIREGLSQKANFVERRLAPGEGKTKIAFFCFSSGTTGKPKAVVIQHYAPIANILQLALHFRIHEDYAPWDQRRNRPGDVHLACLPFFHVYGLIFSVHYYIFAAMSLVVVPKFTFKGMLEGIVRYKITHLALVPPQIVLLCKSPETKKYDLSSVRVAGFGAAPVSAELTNQLIAVIPQAVTGQGFGMTELATLTLMFPLEARHGIPGSAGRLMPGCVAKVVKSDGTLAKRGEPGEFVIKSPSVALGYFNNPTATAETFVDGWVRSGDEVIVDEEDNFFIVDRLKELIKVRGFQVAPAELEAHLLAHPSVADACVVGLPDEYSGEVPLAFVVRQPKVASANPEDLRAEIKKYVADTKVYYKHLVGGVEFVDEIPKTPSGKLLRRVLKTRAKEILAERAAAVHTKL